MTFFRDSKIDVYKEVKIRFASSSSSESVYLHPAYWYTHIPIPLQMWHFMEEHQPSVFVKDYEEGIDRVKQGGYAFLMESTMLDYVVQVSGRRNDRCEANNVFYHVSLSPSATAT